jgi:hypothetical protein
LPRRNREKSASHDRLSRRGCRSTKRFTGSSRGRAEDDAKTALCEPISELRLHVAIEPESGAPGAAAE